MDKILIGYLGRRAAENGDSEWAYPRTGLYQTPEACRKYAFRKYAVGSLYARTKKCEVVPVYAGQAIDQ